MVQDLSLLGGEFGVEGLHEGAVVVQVVAGDGGEDLKVIWSALDGPWSTMLWTAIGLATATVVVLIAGTLAFSATNG